MEMGASNVITPLWEFFRLLIVCMLDDRNLLTMCRNGERVEIISLQASYQGVECAAVLPRPDWLLFGFGGIDGLYQ